MPAEPEVITNGPLRELAEVRAGSGFAWSCRTVRAGNGELTETHQITSGDRGEYERHMHGHGFKPPKSAYRRWTPWTPPRPAKEYKPKPMDPGQRVQWVRVVKGHWEGRTYVEATDTTVARFEGGTWAGEVRQTRTGVLWSVADTASAWWVQPDDDPMHPVYVKRAGKREHSEYGEGTLYEVPGVAEAARASAMRAETIRARGILPVIDSQSASYGGYGAAGTNRIYLAWHSDPHCPRAAGKDRYDPGNRPPGIVYGYQPQGRAARPLAQPRWTVWDVADTLVSGEQPPSCLCPDCIVNLDPHRPVTLTAVTTPDPASLPGAATGADAGTSDSGAPQQTTAATRPGQARPGSHEPGPGGTGHGTPGDPDHHPGHLAQAGRSPRGTKPVTTRLAIGLERPATDGDFLQTCARLSGTLTSLARQLSDWADGLAALNLPAPVLDPLRQASDRLTDAADGTVKAAAAFEGEFGDARDLAARGMTITGQDTA